jgi:hypothetical protein
VTARPHTRPGPGRASVLAVLAALAFQLALIGSWGGAMKSPSLHEQPVGLAAVAGAQDRVAQFAGVATDAVTWRSVSGPQSAEQAVARGDLAAAVVVEPAAATLYVASGAGIITAQALTTVLQARAERAGMPLRVDDLHPPESGDPRTLGLFVLVLGWVLGGIIGAALLGRVARLRRPSARSTAVLIGWQLGFAVVAAVLVTVLADPLLGMAVGHPVALTAAGALVMWSITAFVSALTALFGSIGLVLAGGALVIVGNPISGAMVPTRMLPSGWHFLSEVVPNSAAARLVREFTFFDNHDLAQPLLVLFLYGGASVLVTLLVTFGRIRAMRHAAPVARAEVTTPAHA